MKKKILVLVLVTLSLLFLISSGLFAQGRPYEGPDDPAGDVAAERTGWMTGNRVLLFFRNTTELSDCCDLGYDVSKWPNDYSGTKMHDGIHLLIGARVYIENDTIPVTRPEEIKTRTDLDTLYYCQTSYREFMDMDPTRTIEWGLYPVFGYFNELSETPAMSNRPDSWPPEGWPSREGTLKWPGEWNGRFGRGVIKADQECFFVANDAQDQEYLGPEDRVKYYPRPGVRIGDKRPQVTIQKGLPWGGIGIRVEARGFQWSNPSAQDAIFWEYNIANISDYDLPEMYFGLQIDNAVGGEEYAGADDIAYYDKYLDMCYSWDLDGIPVGGGKEPGVLGLAYLESPGIPYDHIDNDDDGLVDEKRDNKAVQKVGPYDGISDLNKFLIFYNYKEEDLHEHWDADEDQDWQDGKDLNGNGRYDEGEEAWDDVGLDGVGPYDLNYTGPDADGTECNHKPDLEEGIGAEPNFGFTDVSESDMLGLTSFRYLLSWGPGKPGTADSDQSIFERLNQGIFDEAQMKPQNFIEQFASGLFPLYKGRTERISMSELHAYDPLAGLNSSEHESPSLFRLKEIVQLIYETDYRFVLPPIMPTLKAIPADGKVILTWDDRADRLTREALLKNENDFEGYKLYRATDKYLSDPQVITDGYGTPMLRKPIFQCDILDKKRGFTDYGLINGMGYYLGDDSGICHAFIDNTVQNGRTYYYVLTAYDYGIPEAGAGIPPSENTFVLELDENENIRRVSSNVAVVKPHQMAAGFQMPGIEIHEDLSTKQIKTFNLQPEILDFGLLKDGHTYKVKFHIWEIDHWKEKNNSPYDLLFANDGLTVWDVTAGDSVVYQESPARYPRRNLIEESYQIGFGSKVMWHYNQFEDLITDPFEGLRLQFRIPYVIASFDSINSGWLVGNAPIGLHVTPQGIYFPWDYEIVFTEQASYTTRINRTSPIEDHTGTRLNDNMILLGQSFNFYVLNTSFIDSTGSHPLMDLVIYDVNRNKAFDRDKDYVLVGDAVVAGKDKIVWGGTIFALDFHQITNPNQMPKPNDVYRVTFKRPMSSGDSLMFTVHFPSGVDKARMAEDMSRISVVPNPYVATNTMEPALANWQRNQQRQLMFTHLPAQCTIKIFTVSGVLVDEIEVNNSVSNRQTPWDLNSEANGTVHWDMLTKEGLEIAAGYYIYHVKSKLTGDVKIGKFAVIK
ncbi:MAG: hypothetical protein ONB05_00845 [candidate division KSB1 bacterium]|nr:hypothetical protein [candidate division KSB1 bacterium]